MKIGRLLGLFLLLWMDLKKVTGEERISSFVRDVMATFRLTSPTIVYDSDEAPEICYTDQWVLCMSSESSGDQETDPNEATEDGKNIFLYALFSCICTVIFGWFLRDVGGGKNLSKKSYAQQNHRHNFLVPKDSKILPLFSCA